jgi:hypothetical protein
MLKLLNFRNNIVKYNTKFIILLCWFIYITNNLIYSMYINFLLPIGFNILQITKFVLWIKQKLLKMFSIKNFIGQHFAYNSTLPTSRRTYYIRKKRILEYFRENQRTSLRWNIFLYYFFIFNYLLRFFQVLGNFLFLNRLYCYIFCLFYYL